MNQENLTGMQEQSGTSNPATQKCNLTNTSTHEDNIIIGNSEIDSTKFTDYDKEISLHIKSKKCLYDGSSISSLRRLELFEEICLLINKKLNEQKSGNI